MYLLLDPTDADRTARAAAALQCTVDAKVLSPASSADVASELVDPAQLSSTARERLIAELFSAKRRLRARHDTTRGLASRDEQEQAPTVQALERFAASLVPPRAGQTTLCVYRDHAQVAVGYLACHLYEVTVDAGPIRVLRVSTCVPADLPRARAASFFFTQASWALLRSGGRALYFAQALSDPGAYAWLFGVADRIWPRPARATPRSIELLRAQICGELGLAPSDDDPELFAADPASSSPDPTICWRRHHRPEVHYFVGKNPNFDQGQGLLTLVPLTIGGLIRASLRAAKNRMVRGLHRPRRSPQLPALPSALVRGRDERQP